MSAHPYNTAIDPSYYPQSYTPPPFTTVYPIWTWMSQPCAHCCCIPIDPKDYPGSGESTVYHADERTVPHKRCCHCGQGYAVPEPEPA